MASRFWVGGGSANTWAATANTNWATTSGGSNNASVPTTTDVAIFDSNSGTSNSVIGASIAIQGLECDGSTAGTGTYAGTLTHNTGVTLTINSGLANSLRLTSGITYTPASTSSLVTFTNTSGTASLKSAGKNFGAITVNGVGGTVQQQDDLLISAFSGSALTITNGIFDGNSHALTLGAFSSNNSNTRSWLLGSSVTFTGTAQSFIMSGSGLTFTKNSANFTFNNPGANGVIIFTATNTFNALTLAASTVSPTFRLAGSNTFSNVTIGSGWSFEFNSNLTLTVTNAFTWTGTAANPISVWCVTDTQQGTISVASGSCSMTWGSLYNIVASGGATFTATNSFGTGTTTGWSISPPAPSTFTAAALATAVWQDTTSGDFTVAGSIGKSLFTSGNAPGAASGIALVGSNVNANQIGGSATAATNLASTTQAIGRGTVTTGGSTTSIPTSAFTPAGAVANQFVGRTILFDATTTTAALQGQAAAISASSNAATPTFTVAAMTTAPVSGDTFSVI